MKKGKHSSKKVKRKKRIRWERIFGLIFTIAIIFVGINQIKNFNINKNEETQGQDVDEEETIETSSQEVEEVIVEHEDEKMKLLIQELQTTYGLNESNFSFFYYDIQQKGYYFYNQDTYFTAASTIKMPIAMVYYDEINSGTLSIDSTLTYKQGCYEAGGGSTVAQYKVGSQVPLQFLLEQSIVNSDNTATNILIENFGYKECKYEVARYAETELPENFYSQNITSAQYGYDVVSYLYEHQTEYEELMGFLKRSSGGQYLKKYITEYDVAHKYGSYNGYVHDYGIVFSGSPYLIGIFTKNVANADEVIAKISLQVLEKNKET